MAKSKTEASSAGRLLNFTTMPSYRVVFVPGGPPCETPRISRFKESPCGDGEAECDTQKLAGGGQSINAGVKVGQGRLR